MTGTGGRLIDISQPLGGDTACWPGDQPFELEWTMLRARGDTVDAAAIRTSVHTGTHVDGPAHVMDGPGAGSLPLEAFMGPAAVVDARSFIEGEPPAVGAEALDGVDADRTPRVLFRTRGEGDARAFPERVAALSPTLARRVVEEGFVLVGTDAPSVDPIDSGAMETHRILAEAGIPNMENLVLSGVRPGMYTFIGFPLKLTDADSAPVRAVLVP